MPAPDADRGMAMEWAIVYGALCTVTDCAWQKIEKKLVVAGLAAGLYLELNRIFNGTGNWAEAVAALLPGVAVWSISLLTEGKIGRGDGNMLLVVGLLLGGNLCVTVLCTACLLTALYAGTGMTLGRLKKDSRIPFAPFLLAAMGIVWTVILGGN